jgi:hypothetical protein
VYYIQAFLTDRHQSNWRWLALDNAGHLAKATDIRDATPISIDAMPSIVGQLLREWNPVEIRVMID